MNKKDFLFSLEKALSGLPKEEVDERLAFYNEIIEDRVEDGLSEEQAVMEIGSLEEIVSQVISETSLTTLVKGKIKTKRKLKIWEIILLALGSPAWLSLLIAAVAVVLSLYVSLWSIIIFLWAVFVSLTACGVYGMGAGIDIAVSGNAYTGIAMIGAGIICVGLSIFMFFVCKAATRGLALFTKKIIITIKRRFIKKEEA